MPCWFRKRESPPRRALELADWQELSGLDNASNWRSLVDAHTAEALHLLTSSRDDWQARRTGTSRVVQDTVSVWSRPVVGTPMLATVGEAHFDDVGADALFCLFVSTEGFFLIDKDAEDHAATRRACFCDSAEARVDLCQTLKKPPCAREFITLNSVSFEQRTFVSYSVRSDAFPEQPALPRAWNRFAIRTLPSGERGCVCHILNWFECGGDAGCLPDDAANSFMVDRFLQGIFARTREHLRLHPPV